MKSKMRISKILFAVLIAIAVIFASINLSTAKSKAEATPALTISSVSVRAATGDNDDSGIRFTAKIEEGFFKTLTKENSEETIFFGIEISAKNGSPIEICTVVSDKTNYPSFKELDFTGGYAYYNAYILYNTEQLKHDLALSEAHNANYNPTLTDEENIEAFDDDILNAYLYQAYALELTAKPFYTVGAEGEKVYGSNQVKRSIWGIASNAYASGVSEVESLLTKYFKNVTKDTENVYIQEDGEIVGYNKISTFSDSTEVYVNSQKTSIKKEGGKYYLNDLALLDGISLKAKVSISFIDKTTADMDVVECIYVTGAIDEVSDFKTFFDLDEQYTTGAGEKLGEIVDGYFVLAKDIDAEGTDLDLTHEKMQQGYSLVSTGGNFYGGFVGEFDGKGHAISNFVPSKGGLFGILAGAPTVQNVAFVNLTETATGNALCLYGSARNTSGSNCSTDLSTTVADNMTYGGRTINERNAIINSFGTATRARIADIYVSLSKDTTVANGVLFENKQYYIFENMYGTVIDALNANITGTSYSFFANDIVISPYMSIESLYVLTDKPYVSSNGSANATHAGIKLYADYNAFKSADFTDFTAPTWEKDQATGIAFFKGLKDTVLANSAYTKEVGKTEKAVSFETSSDDMEIELFDGLANKITELDSFTCKKDNVISNNVAFENGKVVIKTFEVGTYVCTLNKGNVTVEITIVMSYKKETVQTSNVYVQQDGEIVGAVSCLTENGYSQATFNGKDTTVTKTNNKYYVASPDFTGKNYLDNVTITVTDDNAKTIYEFTAIYVTGAIDEVADFKTFFNLDEEYVVTGDEKLGEIVDGYFVLTKDIDANGTNMGLAHEKMLASTTIAQNGRFYGGFVGTFDGQGHVISNFVPSKGGLFGILAGAPTVKNVAFENVTEGTNANVLALYNFYRATYNAGVGSGFATSSADLSNATFYGGRTIKERNDIILKFELYSTAHIDDIFVSLSKNTTTVDGLFYQNSQYFTTGAINNVIVDATKATIGSTYSFVGDTSNANAFGSSVSNLYIITDKQYVADNGTKHALPSGAAVFADYEAFKSANVASFTASCWEKDGGILFFKSLKNTIYKENICVVDGDGNSLSSVSTNATGEYTISGLLGDISANNISDFTGDATVFAIDGNVIKVISFIEGNYTVSFKVNFNGEEMEVSIPFALEALTFNVSSEAIYDATENKIYYRDDKNAKQVVSGTMEYVVNDSEKYQVESNDISYMHLDFIEYDYARNKYYGNLKALNPMLSTDSDPVNISIPYSIRDEVYTGVKFDVTQEGAIYHFTNVIIATAVIDDGAELKQIFNQADKTLAGGARVYLASTGNNYRTQKYGTITKGVYMLADNIDASAEGSEFVFDNSYFNYFEGVLDGRGYTISNLDVSGTEEAPGNGLFSAISEASFIQNIAFTNVTAEYGSVFMGNLVDNGYNPTYDGAQIYRDQLFGEGSQTEVSTVLKSRSRVGAAGLNGWLNVYVQVSPSTSHLMGVISRNLPNLYNTVKAHGLVIEYLPTDASAYDNMTNSTFGVLFGGAYSLNSSAAGDYAYWTFDGPDNYCSYGSLHGIRSYYNMSGCVENGNWTGRGVLDFADVTDSYYVLASEANSIFVISPVGLVSSNKGAVKGTNEEVGDDEYKFIVMKTAMGTQKLERYDSYDALAEKSYTVNNFCGLYLGNGNLAATGFNKHWSITGGKIAWISK